MFDLNRAISEWRESMASRGIKSGEALDELESHLRDLVEEKLQAGFEGQEAFKVAVEQLGTSADLAAEFKKVQPEVWLPTRIAKALVLFVVIFMGLMLSRRLQSGRMDLLLASHVLAVTVGYLTTFVIGGLGICYVCVRWVKQVSPVHLKSISRTTFRLTSLAMVSTAVGVVLGAIWANDHSGRYWGWDAREVGGLAVLGWLILGFAIQRCAVGTHPTMMLTIVGDIVVALAWFAPNLLGNGLKSYGEVGDPLLWVIAGNIVFLLIGLLPARVLRPRQDF
jgi:Cytochrome C assembly protein